MGNKVNLIYPIYAIKLSLYAKKKLMLIYKKINKSNLNNFEMVIVDYLVKNKLEKV